ncbi:MAG: LptE family protein [Cyclobacteriaceae bacterium]
MISFKGWVRSMLLSATLLMVVCSCGVYSFTGVNTTAETVSIQNFFNDTGEGPADLSQRFTEELRDYFQQNTNLTLVDVDGDLQIEGSITSYNTRPVAPTAARSDQVADVAGLTRLTIQISVDYVNTENEELDFNRGFSFYEDYDSRSSTLSAEEDRLIEVIFDQVVFDIFNATVADW